MATLLEKLQNSGMKVYSSTPAYSQLESIGTLKVDGINSLVTDDKFGNKQIAYQEDNQLVYIPIKDSKADVKEEYTLAIFETTRDIITDTGKVIPKGTKKVFAV